jgi:hypothetical protein
MRHTGTALAGCPSDDGGAVAGSISIATRTTLSHAGNHRSPRPLATALLRGARNAYGPCLLLWIALAGSGCKPSEADLLAFGWGAAVNATEVRIKFIPSGEQRTVGGADLRQIIDAFATTNIQPVAGPAANEKVASFHFLRAGAEIGTMTYYHGSIMLERVEGRYIYVRLKDDPIGPLLARIK